MERTYASLCYLNGKDDHIVYLCLMQLALLVFAVFAVFTSISGLSRNWPHIF